MASDLEDFLESQELAHYGVPGMKWGRRKSESKSGGSTDHKQAQRLKAKPVSDLSNKQLKTLTSRQELERKYNQLNPSTLKRGQTAMQALIGVPITAIGVYNLVKSPAGQATINLGKAAVKNAMNDINKYKYAVGITKAITR